MPVLVPAPRSATCPADPALLSRLAAGDDATWRQVVRQYEGLLRGSARAVLRNDADVDEAVQRTWILLLNNADRINDVDRLPGWLATTVRREALAVVRGQQRTIPSEDVGDRAGVDDLDLATDLLRAELEEALHEAVKALPPTQQLPGACAAARAGVLRRPQPRTGHPPGQPGPAAGTRRPHAAQPARAELRLTRSVPVLRAGTVLDHVLDALPDGLAHREVGMGLDGLPQPGLEVVVEVDVLLGSALGADDRQLDR